MSDMIAKIKEIGLVPVIKINDAEQAVPLAEALIRGGLPCAEVTFRTAAAAEAIARIHEAYPEMLLGAGTVLTTAQADQAVKAGASFIVSPGLNPKVVQHCIDNGYPIIPGTSNASDIEIALELGLTTVKFFPAEAMGGLKAIKALAAPYTAVSFMPTGGINAGNVRDYLAFPRIIACGGSWMVPDKLLSSGDYAGIEALTREAVRTMLGLQIEFGSEQITIHTTDLTRAVRFLTSQGVALNTAASSEKSVPFTDAWNGTNVILLQD